MKNITEEVVCPALSARIMRRKTTDPGRTMPTRSLAVLECWPEDQRHYSTLISCVLAEWVGVHDHSLVEKKVWRGPW